MIVSGSRTQSLAAALADQTRHELADVSFDRFPDGEGIVRIDDAPTHAVVVASTVSDRAHIELLQLQDAVREAGADRVTTVLPYMGYARQDRPFDAGQPVSARAVARAISTGSTRVLVVEPHERSVCDWFTVPATAVDAAERLAVGLSAEDPLVVAPDAGATDLARSVRDAHGTGECAHFEKRRYSDTDVELEFASAETVADRQVVLVDDIVATGGTMCEAARLLTDRGAAQVTVACVHPLLVRGAHLKLLRAGVDTVIGTDTIEQPMSTVTVAPAIAGALSLS
ncbi:MAG: ribose-phosphate pyrophosphokinase [halophilic archaeon J07HX5]|nr:MAG: ribose-phosphate pyrophosphokinase [halophilic archaeon J07HX5]